MEALSEWDFPMLPYDGGEWGDEIARSRQGGKRLSCLGALVLIKGDWLEFTKSFWVSVIGVAVIPMHLVLGVKSEDV